MTTQYDEKEAIKRLKTIKDDEIDFSDIPEITEIPKNARRGRPFAQEKKKSITIRLSADVLEGLKKTGKGWQTRINDFLREMLLNKKF